MEWIAEEQVIFQHADGRRIPGRIAVGLPVTITEGVEAHCAASLEGLDHRAWPIAGSTPLQALLLAVSFLGMRLHDFMSNGGRVLDPKDDSNFGIEAYFGPLLRHATAKPEDMEAFGHDDDAEHDD